MAADPTGQWLTLAFLLALLALVIGYDVLIIRAYGVDSSISRVLHRGFTASPTFFAAALFALGVFIGHCFLHTD